MSRPAPIEPLAPLSPPPAPTWRVRPASYEDAPAVAAAVRELLLELGATPPSVEAMEATARALIDDRGAGVLLVAQADERIVGVLAASVQIAMHAAGRYALIQDLWVHCRWRRRAIGGALISELCDLASEQHLASVEVGLPRERFAHIRATGAFYLSNGFQPLGARMRRVLS